MVGPLFGAKLIGPPRRLRDEMDLLAIAGLAGLILVKEAGVPLPNNQLFQTGRPVTFGVGPGRVGPGTGVGRPGFTRSSVPPPRRTPGLRR